MPIDVNGNSINSLGTRLFNSTEIVSNGLVWYYDAGIADSYAGSGTSIVDFTGNGNNSTLSDFSYVNTYGGSFQNTTSRNGSPGIQVPLTNFSKLVGTCEFWVRPTTYSSGNGMFVNRADDTANASDWWWLGIWDSGNRLYLRLGNSAGCCGNDNSPSWSGVHPVNTWGHYAATWNSGVESKIYFNGVLNSTVSITSIPNSNPSSTGRWGLGHNAGNSQWLGQMGTFKHYNRVLSAAEILQNYQADRTRFGK
jgi:hypothetical protein